MDKYIPTFLKSVIGVVAAVVVMAGVATVVSPSGASQTATVASADSSAGSGLTSAQIQAIVALLQSFGTDASVVSNVQAVLMGQGVASPVPTTPTGISSIPSVNAVIPGTYSGNAAPESSVCPQILRSLDQGSQGSDVEDLQKYLGVSQTGYFGPITAQAVANFQADEGLDQVGTVGPLTRAAFARHCGLGGGSGTGGFSATPRSGPAPLNVNFSYPYSSDTQNGQYTVDFGDGTNGQMKTLLTMNACQQGTDCTRSGSWWVSHTYTTNGTYSAKLIYQPPMPQCPTGLNCAQALPMPQTIGTVRITVGDSSGVCEHAAPPQGCYWQSGSTCSQDQLVCVPQTNLCPPPQPTTACNGTWRQVQLGAHSVDPNACEIGWACIPDYPGDGGSGSGSTGTGTTGGGKVSPTYTLSATPTSGSAPLSVNFSYPYNNDTQSGQYTVNFGDGTSGQMNVMLTASACTMGSDCTRTGSWGLNHVYSSAGTYTATLSSQYCPGGQIGACAAPQTIGTVTITVTSGSGTSNTPSSQSFDAAGILAAVVAAPFDLMVSSLTQFFVGLGVGR